MTNQLTTIQLRETLTETMMTTLKQPTAEINTDQQLKNKDQNVTIRKSKQQQQQQQLSRKI